MHTTPWHEPWLTHFCLPHSTQYSALHKTDTEDILSNEDLCFYTHHVLDFKYVQLYLSRQEYWFFVCFIFNFPLFLASSSPYLPLLFSKLFPVSSALFEGPWPEWGHIQYSRYVSLINLLGNTNHWCFNGSLWEITRWLHLSLPNQKRPLSFWKKLNYLFSVNKE